MWWRRNRERDLQRELEAHLELETQEQAGDSHAARRALGNLGRVQEDTRSTWAWAAIEHFWRDMREGARAMRRRPVFTFVAALSLAIGIGTNTAVFSFAEAILIRKLPVRDPERLVTLRQHNEAFRLENCCFRYDVFQRLRSQDGDFEDMLALSSTTVILAEEGGAPMSLDGEFVTGNYFDMLGVRPAVGRLLNDSDNGAEDTGAVAVISHRLWMNRFGGRPDIAGARVTINGAAFQIVGVSQPGFTGSALYFPRDIQMPPSMMGRLQGMPRDGIGGWAMVIGRLKPGVSRASAAERLNVIGKRIEKEAGQVISDRDDLVLYDASQGADMRVQQQFSRPVSVLLLLVSVVVLVACANLTALLLVRSAEGVREAGMRVALGASKLALLRRSCAESLLLAGIGGVGGWGIAMLLLPALAAMLRSQNPGLVDGVTANWRVFAYSAGLTLGTAVLFGILPAWRATRADPLQSIQRSTADPARRPRLSRVIVAGQVALSLVLLFCAGLFSRTLANLRSMDLGFPAANLIVIEPDFSESSRSDRAQRREFFAQLEREARALPGVSAASTANIRLLSGTMNAAMIQVPDYAPPAGVRPTAIVTSVGLDYFRTVGVPLRAGREFTVEDRPGEVTPTMVNEQFALQYMAGDALGKAFIQTGNKQEFQVIGVVGTAKFRLIREDPQPTMYVPTAPPGAAGVLYVRAASNPAAIIERLRALVAAIDPRIRFRRLETMAMQVEELLARERLLAFLSACLGGVAMALSAIGLYGVLAFSVVRRTREVGIRVAVGAPRVGILAIFLKEAAGTVVAGVALGVPLALACGRLASTLLYGLEGQDPITAFGATGLMLLVAAAAALIPALRAARVDPMRALRHD